MKSLQILAWALFGASVGCADGTLPDMVPIHGSVSYRGRPLDHGTVIFLPTTGTRQASGEIGRDGMYQLTTLEKGDGAQFGEYKIVIHSLEAHPGEPTRMEYEEAAQRGLQRKQQVPLKYTSPETTPLEVMVDVKHSGTENIELTD
jgi:hypothetical protein